MLLSALFFRGASGHCEKEAGEAIQVSQNGGRQGALFVKREDAAFGSSRYRPRKIQPCFFLAFSGYYKPALRTHKSLKSVDYSFYHSYFLFTEERGLSFFSLIFLLLLFLCSFHYVRRPVRHISLLFSCDGAIRKLFLKLLFLLFFLSQRPLLIL